MARGFPTGEDEGTKLAARGGWAVMEMGFVIGVIEAFYEPVSKEDYETIAAPDVWNRFLEACGYTAKDGSLDPLLNDALDYPSYRSLVNRILTPGVPGSVLPVESLYKNWSDDPENDFAERTGMYLSDHALHMKALYEGFSIKVPERFRAMPDHLVLELEFYQLLLDAGRAEDASVFAKDHLDWISLYRTRLSERAADEDDTRIVAIVLFLEKLTGLLIDVLNTSEE